MYYIYFVTTWPFPGLLGADFLYVKFISEQFTVKLAMHE